MRPKRITVREPAGFVRHEEPVRVSVPFAAGELRDPEAVGLLDPQGRPVPVQPQALSRWKDGSVQWLLCDFPVCAPAGSELRYTLTPGAGLHPPYPSVRVSPGEEVWSIDTQAARFRLDAQGFAPFLAVDTVRGGSLAPSASRCRLVLPDGGEAAARVDSVVLECSGPLRATLLLKGHFATGGGARFACRLHFFAAKSLCLVEFTLHNPRRALHRGGLWDLGDPGSLLFKELAFELRLARAGEPLVLPESGRGGCLPVKGGELSLLQHASGGRKGAGGYRLLRGKEPCTEGSRATPVAWSGTGAGGVGVLLPRCWQEYPKGTAAGRTALRVSLFPDVGTVHELQGGERKETSFWVDFSCAPADLAPLSAPLFAAATPEVFAASGLFADLPAARGDLVDAFLAGPAALFSRREVVDEYGWRDFGDIYADHEAVYHKGEEPFVSHYNNQYDICAGLYRKFFATGDPGWGELAADLARHVLDIDIYHTDEDREEYNGGLFWHTDHYVSAGNATHRTFSAVHLGVKDPRFYGGGPAAEHCYTSGLLTHYYLTGNPDFRDAVVGLAEWCYLSLAGAPLLVAALKRCRGYLDRLKNCGGRAPLFPRFPLTRGTGNALVANLDAFQATGDRKYLERGEELVRGALHPCDDLEARDLLNAEVAWSYTVLLVAVAKFLDKKSELKEWDPAYCYARDALLHYASWMARHEYPFLEKKEILEFPNETWAAQDLRKAVVLHHAARYAADGQRHLLLEKAKELVSAARRDLESFPTSNCTRPVALMLQNGWIARALERSGPPAAPHDVGTREYGPPPARLSLGSIAARFAVEIGRALRESSPGRELDWLKARMG